MARAFSTTVALSVLFCLAYGEDECQGKTGLVRYKSPESDHEFLLLCSASGATLLGCFVQDGPLVEPGSAFQWYDETGFLGVDYICKEEKQADGSWLMAVGCASRQEGLYNFGRQYRPFYRHPELAFHCRKTADGAAFEPLSEACASGADPAACGCSEDEFACSSLPGRGPPPAYTCLPNANRCDTQNDCLNWADEMNCTSCAGDAFFCGPNATFRSCLTIFERCDGVDDCGDGSDEANCENVPCPGGGFKCGEGGRHRCVNPTYRCDGDNDCGNGADEEGCDASPPPSR